MDLSIQEQNIQIPQFPQDRATREIDIETDDNLLLHGWQVEPVGEPKANLVIVHGFKDYSERYLDFAHKLAQRGFQVFAYDQRGHARSQGDRAYFPDFMSVVNDLDDAIRTFKAYDNSKPWFVMGHSVGAAVTSRYAITNLENIDGFIFSAPPLKRMPKLTDFLVKSLKVLNLFAPHFGTIDLPNRDFSRDPKVVASMYTDPFIVNKKIPTRSGVSALENMEFVKNNRGRINVPFLVLHGTVDNINNIEGSRELFEGTMNIPGKDMKLYTGLSHDLLHEPEHTMVEDDIINWMESMLKKNYIH